VAHLALAVRHAGRDAVGVQAQAAHAEAGARTETARADLQILRVVVAVRDHQAGHTRHRLGQVDHRARAAQRGGIDNADRIRRFGGNTRARAAGDDDHRRFIAGRLGGCVQAREQQASRKGEAHGSTVATRARAG
jgi:hypothetical protein